MGSAAFFFRLAPLDALLSDTNAELIDALKTIGSRPAEVFDAYHGLLPGREWYLAIRDLQSTELTAIERAARFLYLNRNCFNGLYRTNLAGKFNVPYAPTKTGTLPSLDRFMAGAAMLRKASIRLGDFEAIVRAEVGSGEFVYLDPPYAIANRRVFTQYSATTFGLNDVARLKNLLAEIHNRGASFVLSYAYSRESCDLAQGWYSRKVYVDRNISGFAQHRRRAAELIVTNIKRDQRSDT